MYCGSIWDSGKGEESAAAESFLQWFRRIGCGPAAVAVSVVTSENCDTLLRNRAPLNDFEFHGHVSSSRHHPTSPRLGAGDERALERLTHFVYDE